MLIIMCLAVRRFNWKYLLAFAVAVIYGYTLNFFIWVLGGVSFGSIALRWVMLILGDIVTAFGEEYQEFLDEIERINKEVVYK